jgi:gamma-glutamylcyclotransferase (GGCT)/AIG2-like uncharacterized protein YtfP
MGYVFEYGSLMKGMGQDSYLSTSDYLGKTRTKDKFVLVVESTIPYLSVRERAYAVSGELYQVSDIGTFVTKLRYVRPFQVN